MPHYLFQASYTPESWAAMVRDPQDRSAAIRPLIEGLGGKLHEFFFAFGENDVVLLAEAPDNVSVASLAIAIAAAGGVRSLKTTVLMPAGEAQEAMRRAAAIRYTAPGAKVPAGVS
ncbi:MAG: GYD domain-containing protein [Chloroflexi bacterium CFX7]|nr:GYD domain-containing protein [Chloroflexi bacterium CFX7]MCK6563222.1 GYD domain-containing protein [Dehalococcoidia bacterium]MCL4232822.1 GYD domain-containing protein [Dehalococcoidia bacterium]RIL02392.1 MAG: GYD family protein [bacterium]